MTLKLVSGVGMADVHTDHARGSQIAWRRGLRGKDVIPEYDKGDAATCSGRRYISVSRSCVKMVVVAGGQGQMLSC